MKFLFFKCYLQKIYVNIRYKMKFKAQERFILSSIFVSSYESILENSSSEKENVC